jgi:hypothetical protein
MSKLPRIMLALCVLGSTLIGTHALAKGPFGGGGHHHGGYHHGGGHHPGNWNGRGWHNNYAYTRYYYAPSAIYVPTVARYFVPPEYAGTPGGYIINYGGVNYVTNGDGTMSPN